MCTVTLLPLTNNNFILTSNRDEHPNRETIPPKRYVENGVEMIFPKDKLAGGTWIGLSEKNRLVCVLNGAFKNHIKKNQYKKSRGIIAKEIIQASEFVSYISELDLEGIEPFTMVVVDWSGVDNLYYELIWNEEKKHFNKLKNEPKIWSSSTLYENEMKSERKKWFAEWLETAEQNSKEILKFHHLEKGDKTQTILMCRPNCETVSITQVEKKSSEVNMIYKDMASAKITSINL